MTKRTETIIPKASKEMLLEAAKLTNAEARFLVTDYYASQEMRKRADMQVRHQGDAAAEERVSALTYMGNSFTLMENEIKKMLNKFAEGSPVGRWMLAQTGIGPVIAAGMLAHLDIEKAPTVGHFWSFAGLNPEQKWEKGEKRPYNAALKQICYHAGECFKREPSPRASLYGVFYEERKALIKSNNEAGKFAEKAKTFITNSAEWKKVLKTGKLPDGHLDRRACNQTVRIFLSHLHAVMFWDHYKKPPPKPFAIAILGHAHDVPVPNMEMFPGFREAYYGSAMTQDEAEVTIPKRAASAKKVVWKKVAKKVAKKRK